MARMRTKLGIKKLFIDNRVQRQLLHQDPVIPLLFSLRRDITLVGQAVAKKQVMKRVTPAFEEVSMGFRLRKEAADVRWC